MNLLAASILAVVSASLFSQPAANPPPQQAIPTVTQPLETVFAPAQPLQTVMAPAQPIQTLDANPQVITVAPPAHALGSQPAPGQAPAQPGTPPQQPGAAAQPNPGAPRSDEAIAKALATAQLPRTFAQDEIKHMNQVFAIAILLLQYQIFVNNEKSQEQQTYSNLFKLYKPLYEMLSNLNM